MARDAGRQGDTFGPAGVRDSLGAGRGGDIDKNGYVGRADLLRIVEAYRDNPEEDPATPENLDNALSRLRRAFAHAAGIPTSEMTSLVETKRGLGHRLGLRKLGLEPGDIAIF